MTFPTTSNTTLPHPSGTELAAQLRDAMGPGYQVAVFREDPVVTGAPLAAANHRPTRRTPVRPVRPARRRTSPLRLPRFAIGFGRLIGLRFG